MISKIVITGIVALYLFAANNVESCNYDTLYGCSAAQSRWIAKDKSEKRLAGYAEQDARKESRRRYKIAQKKRNKEHGRAIRRQRNGESSIIEYDDGTWTEIRHARNRKGIK